MVLSTSPKRSTERSTSADHPCRHRLAHRCHQSRRSSPPMGGRARCRPARCEYPIVVPHLVGEAFTKLRDDKRVSPRRDASAALSTFAMADENSATFRGLPPPPHPYPRPRHILLRP